MSSVKMRLDNVAALVFESCELDTFFRCKVSVCWAGWVVVVICPSGQIAIGDARVPALPALILGRTCSCRMVWDAARGN